MNKKKSNLRGNWTDKECFYVSVIDGNRYNLLAGPFKDHQSALDKVDEVKEVALNYGDPKAYFYAYGTCKVPNGYREGILNSKIGL